MTTTATLSLRLEALPDDIHEHLKTLAELEMRQYVADNMIMPYSGRLWTAWYEYHRPGWHISKREVVKPVKATPVAKSVTVPAIKKPEARPAQIEVKKDNLCKKCGKIIPPTGKRGRPATFHDACKPAK